MADGGVTIEGGGGGGDQMVGLAQAPIGQEGLGQVQGGAGGRAGGGGGRAGDEQRDDDDGFR